MKTILGWFVVGVIVAICALIVVVQFLATNECEASGGKAVRGVFNGMECIKP